MIRRAGQLPTRKTARIEKQMSDDLQWAMRALAVQKHAGKLVAVHKKRVRAVGTQRNSVLTQATLKACCPTEDIVVLVVPSGKLFETPR